MILMCHIHGISVYRPLFLIGECMVGTVRDPVCRVSQVLRQIQMENTSLSGGSEFDKKRPVTFTEQENPFQLALLFHAPLGK